MSRARSQAGFTLVEVLLACSLTTILLAATLGVFATLERNTRVNQDANGIQDETRVVIDTVARQMRNLASQSDNVFRPIERAEPQDIIFRTVRKTAPASPANPTNIQRVRYCLNSSRQLYSQTQILADAATAAPIGTACPLLGGGWTSQRLLSGLVVNGARPMFGYMLAIPTPETYAELQTVTTDAQLEQVVGVRTTIFVDDDVKRDPPERALETRVFLRNQNRKPTASFTAVPGPGLSLQLNAGDSTDAEGGRLTFAWTDTVGTAPPKSIGTGAVLNATFAAGTHEITVTVTDPSGNSAIAAPQKFSCATSTGCSPL